MVNMVFLLMLGFFLVGTPVLLYASWLDEWFGIIKRAQPKQPQFTAWLSRKPDLKNAAERRVTLMLVRG